MPALMLDDVDAWAATPRQAEIHGINRARAESLRRLVLPGLLRHVYPAYRIEAAPPKVPDPVMDTGGDVPESRVAMLESPSGQLFLRDLCPPSLIERLRPDAGLVAFTRRPQREHAILQRVAASGHGSVTVAHTKPA